MRRAPKLFLAGTGFAVGMFAVRLLRNRKLSTEDEEMEMTVSEPLHDAQTAAEHAMAALEHARIAAELTAETVSEEVDAGKMEEPERESTVDAPTRRLRRVGKGWIRS